MPRACAPGPGCRRLTPQTIVRPFFIPLWRWFEITRLEQMLLHDIVVQRDSQAGLTGNLDEASVHAGLLHALNEIDPPHRLRPMVLPIQEVFGSRRAVRVR